MAVAVAAHIPVSFSRPAPKTHRKRLRSGKPHAATLAHTPGPACWPHAVPLAPRRPRINDGVPDTIPFGDALFEPPIHDTEGPRPNKSMVIPVGDLWCRRNRVDADSSYLSTGLSTVPRLVLADARADGQHGDMRSPTKDLAEVIDEYDGVLSTAIALRYMTQKQLRCRVSSGRWQKPSRGVVIAQSGPLTDRQILRVALHRAGPRSALAGLTAARLDGFKGFDDKAPFSGRPIYLLIPYGYKRRCPAARVDRCHRATPSFSARQMCIRRGNRGERGSRGR